ncbi:MAG: NADH-quinone oxidoreductase subunit L [Thermoprotei archaeon]|jgi:NADH-quinone oxidoreductase subunit L
MSLLEELLQASPWLTWGLPMLGAILTPLFALLGKKVRDIMAPFFAFLAAISAVLLFIGFGDGERHLFTYPWIPTLNINVVLRVDPLSIFMANVVAWISFLIMVYSIGYMKDDPSLTRYWFFMNYFIGNMLLLVLSDNLLQLFIAWEGVGICSYQLIGFWYTDDDYKTWVGDIGKKALGVDTAYSPSHSGIKAFIMTRLGDAGFLVGILTLYMVTHTFNLSQIEDSLSSSSIPTWLGTLISTGLLVPSLLLLLGGPIGKSAQFPLHEWLPDAMTGPSSVSALIHAATMVKAGVFFVARFSPLVFMIYEKAGPQMLIFFETVAWIGVLTAFIAATQAMVSTEVKKVLAYSTVSQIGYMMLALGVAGLMTNFIMGYFAGLFHLMSHAIFKASLFLASGALIHATETRYMTEMGGLKNKMKITFISMLIAGLSLIGMPPLSGFWSKDAIFIATLEAGQPIMYILAVITAILTAFYTLRMIGIIFFGPTKSYDGGGDSSHHHTSAEGHHEVHEAPKVMWVPYMTLSLASLIIGLLPLIPGINFEIQLEEFLSRSISFVHVIEEISPIHEIYALTGTALALILGGLTSYYIYIKGVSKILSTTNPLYRGIQAFLYNRWYINAIYYRIFVNGIFWLSRNIYKWFDRFVIDGFYNTVMPIGTLMVANGVNRWFEKAVIDKINDVVAGAGSWLSKSLRESTETGAIQKYLALFIIGFSLIALFILLR